MCFWRKKQTKPEVVNLGAETRISCGLVVEEYVEELRGLSMRLGDMELVSVAGELYSIRFNPNDESKFVQERLVFDLIYFALTIRDEKLRSLVRNIVTNLYLNEESFEIMIKRGNQPTLHRKRLALRFLADECASGAKK